MANGAWKEYFIFTKKERIAVYILLGVMAVFIFFLYWYKPAFTAPQLDATLQQKLTAVAQKHNFPAVDSSDEDNNIDSVKASNAAVKYTAKNHELFYFDPNTLDSMGWRKLGFGEKTVSHILAYRLKAKFKQPVDLYNIPRIRKKLVAEVLPYVTIGTAGKTVVPAPKLPAQAEVKQPVLNGKGYTTININTATAADFKAFPGVSDAVANRIIRFRTSMGGFKSIDDVAKTYGLSDSSFKIMKPFLSL